MSLVRAASSRRRRGGCVVSTQPAPRLEHGTVRQFLCTYSDTPPTTPRFELLTASGAATVVSTATAASSGANVWFANVLLPNTPGWYWYAFVTSFTQGVSRIGELIQLVPPHPPG